MTKKQYKRRFIEDDIIARNDIQSPQTKQNTKDGSTGRLRESLVDDKTEDTFKDKEQKEK